jgi:hypothetical protein
VRSAERPVVSTQAVRSRRRPKTEKKRFIGGQFIVKERSEKGLRKKDFGHKEKVKTLQNYAS